MRDANCPLRYTRNALGLRRYILKVVAHVRPQRNIEGTKCPQQGKEDGFKLGSTFQQIQTMLYVQRGICRGGVIEARSWSHDPILHCEASPLDGRCIFFDSIVSRSRPNESARAVERPEANRFARIIYPLFRHQPTTAPLPPPCFSSGKAVRCATQKTTSCTDTNGM